MRLSVRPPVRRRLSRIARLRTRVVVVATDADGRSRAARRTVASGAEVLHQPPGRLTRRRRGG